MVPCSSSAKEDLVPCRFFGETDGDGHLFWECSFTSLVQIRGRPRSAQLFSVDRSRWPRCLVWHGWLPALFWSCRWLLIVWSPLRVLILVILCLVGIWTPRLMLIGLADLLLLLQSPMVVYAR